MKPLHEHPGSTSTSTVSSVGEAVVVARLLATEVRLYNEDVMENIGDLTDLPDRVAKDLVKVYRKYVEEVGRAGSLKRTFVAEAAMSLTSGDERLIAKTLAREDSRPRAVRTS